MKLNKLVLKFVSISFSILVMLLVVIGLIKLGSFCYDFGYRVFTEGPVEEKPGTDVTVDVTGDLSEYQIGKLLKKEGLIRDANLFYVQLRMSAYHGKLKTGTYTLNTSMTAKDMMVVMAAESEESTESTESTEQRTDLDSSDGTSSDDTGADNAAALAVRYTLAVFHTAHIVALPALEAGVFIHVPMQVKDLSAAGALVQRVAVLRDD